MSDMNTAKAKVTEAKVTAPCMLCGESSVVELTVQEAAALAGGAYIQDALADREVGFRELVLTGTHPACWIAMFGEAE